MIFCQTHQTQRERKDQTATGPHQGAFKRDAQPVKGARYNHRESLQVKVFLADV